MISISLPPLRFLERRRNLSQLFCCSINQDGDSPFFSFPFFLLFPPCFFVLIPVLPFPPPFSPSPSFAPYYIPVQPTKEGASTTNRSTRVFSRPLRIKKGLNAFPINLRSRARKKRIVCKQLHYNFKKPGRGRFLVC